MNSPNRASRLQTLPLLMAAALLISSPAHAAVTDIAAAPLGQAGNNPVKPNIQFILDDSGSMAREYVPDSMNSNNARNCYRNHIANQIYYNPGSTYLSPKAADGSDFAAASFSAAWTDGFNTSSSTVNLLTSFRAGNDSTNQAAYYYRYSGTSPSVPVPGTCYADSSYTKVTVPAAQYNNFANWYSYYRTRMLTMKSGVGRAFSQLDGRYRVGFSTIGYTGTTDTDAEYLNIRDFEGAQKTDWFTKLYSQAPGGFTPLRPALSKAGRMFAGKVGADPVQYSCQQNFALLSTDGFWNQGPGYREDGTTLVGDQDGNIARPLYQGAGDRIRTRTDTTNTTYQVAKFDCSGSRQRLRRTIAVNRVEVITENGVQLSSTPSVVSSVTTDQTSCSTTAPTVPSNTSVPGAPQVTNLGTPAGYSDTLADVALYYYKTDLRDSSLSNCTGVAVPPSTVGQNVCANNVPSAAGSTTITDDNAPHQHMTTFTLGLGVDGTLKFAENYRTGGSADFNAITQGTKNWPIPAEDNPTAIDDLWHAAVNGRGTYFSAKNPENVANSLLTFFRSIASKIGSGAAAATSNLEPIAGDNFAFVANYRTLKWDGDLQARTIDLETGLIQETSSWSGRTQLNAQVGTATDSRTIYKWRGTGPTNLESFTGANFTAAQKTAWFNTANLSQYTSLDVAQKLLATSDNLINFLRGQRGFESGVGNVVTANHLFREREFVLGDIVNGRPIFMRLPPFAYADAGYASFKSSVAVKTRPGVVYIAANDGMLHAFDALTGVEKWAYVPTAVLPNVYRLADTNYGDPGNHRYFVDGSPVIGDIYDGSKWKTILVGGLNSGGRSYYALDVTDPDNPKGLWEFTDTNLGLTYGNPLITKQQGGTWVVMFTSGYNNVGPGDGVGRLFVVNADTGAKIREISTGVGSVGTPSGLSKISGFVDDGLVNNSILRAYGGDLLGNLWRFDSEDLVLPAGREAVQLAALQTAGGVAQPITARPELGEINSRTVVFVGTGRLLGTSDSSDTTQQSLYAVQDKFEATGVGNPRTSSCPFVQQTFTSVSDSARSISTNAVDFTTKCGWYLDLNPGNTTPGERINVDMVLQLGVLSVVSNVLEVSACTSGGTSWLYLLNFKTGGSLPTTIGANQSAGNKLGNALAVGQVVYRLPSGKTVSTVTTSDDKQVTVGQPSGDAAGAGGVRIYWRELFDR